jgi:hypothetical protein
VGQLSSFFFIFFIEIDYAYTTFATIVNVLPFFKRKNKHALIRKFNPISNEKKNIITQLLYNIKKSPINLFSLYHMKKNYIREKEKN